MERVHATGIVNGLVKSLEKSLQALEEFMSRFEFDGSTFKDVETAISSSRSDLVTIQGSLQTTLMQSQPDKLLVVLESAEKRLNTLTNSIHNVETLRSISSLRWQSRVLLRRDMASAKSLTVLALEMVGMIRVVQGQIRHAEPPIEVSR